MKTKPFFWKFFSSLRLAIFILVCLAITSIVGTLVPQHESLPFYIERYGNTGTHLITLLHLDAMYSSWWFIALLLLLCANLLICSIIRLPATWRLMTATESTASLSLIRHMEHKGSIHFSPPLAAEKHPTLQTDITRILKGQGFTSLHSTQQGKYTIFSSSKHAWSRLGVFCVHMSILIILAGALYGKIAGFKAFLLLPEQENSSTAYQLTQPSTPLDLGFAVRCDAFSIELYDNGMPKDYRSHLSILSTNGSVLAEQTIEVNHPLHFHGISFYQASFKELGDYLLTITDTQQMDHVFQLTYRKLSSWQANAQTLRFGILRIKKDQNHNTVFKIWLRNGTQDPLIILLKEGEKQTVKLDNMPFTLTIRQRYATGLQVVKDPGVRSVFIGCAILLLGLILTFFFSHQRIWIIMDEKTSPIEIYGSTNKKRDGFSESFWKIKDELQNIPGLSVNSDIENQDQESSL